MSSEARLGYLVVQNSHVNFAHQVGENEPPILTSRNANPFISTNAHSGGLRLFSTSLAWLALEQGCGSVSEMALG
jgi:hypothetical protein